MANEETAESRQSAIDDSISRLERLRSELEEEIAEGRGRIDELIADIESRLADLRTGAETADIEEPASAVESIRGWVDELAAAVEEEVDEGREAAASIVAELEERVDELERSVRER